MDCQDENKHKLLNNIFLGEVASVHNYGAFVKIPGSRDQGLVHRTQVSKANVDDVTEVLATGERVWCKVINITDDNKIALSMKVVDQGNGIDLDPNGVQIHQDEQRRRSQPPGSQRKVIQLDAVFKTTCTKCGTQGHLSKDCFKSPHGKTYELIPDDDDIPVAVVQEQEQDLDEQKKLKQRKKRRKKEKKHKKEKEMKRKKTKKKRQSSSSRSSSSSSESGSSDDDRSYKRQSKKKRKSQSETDHNSHSKQRKLSESSSAEFSHSKKKHRN